MEPCCHLRRVGIECLWGSWRHSFLTCRCEQAQCMFKDAYSIKQDWCGLSWGRLYDGRSPSEADECSSAASIRLVPCGVSCRLVASALNNEGRLTPRHLNRL